MFEPRGAKDSQSARKTKYIAKMKLAHLFASLVCASIFSTFAQSPDPAKLPLSPVTSIDLQRYQGTWHQVALYPNRFQKSCASNTRAVYVPEPGGTVQVTNRCRTLEGKEMQVVGQARSAHTAVLSGSQLTPPQLQVRFAPAWLAWLPFVWGDYWVIQLAPDYRYAVVGEPQREFLWVLARDTQLSAADWAGIESKLKEQGYDPARLMREKHLP
jgi:apolipoprotein D and lipocalin family protein